MGKRGRYKSIGMGRVMGHLTQGLMDAMSRIQQLTVKVNEQEAEIERLRKKIEELEAEKHLCVECGKPGAKERKGFKDRYCDDCWYSDTEWEEMNKK